MERRIVLAVDDEPDIGALLVHALGDEFAVVVVTDVAAGLAAAELQPPAVIFLDLRMAGQGRDGFDFVDRYQERVGGSAAPIIVSSALPMHEQSRLMDRVAAFLPKPFEIAELTALVRKLAGP